LGILSNSSAQLLSDVEPNTDGGWPRSAFWLTAAIALAFGLVMAYLEFHLGFIHRLTEIDDGVYFGEGVMLVHGVLPYHSYVDVQPPGIAVLMAPFALLGRLVGDRVAFELARLFVVAVGMVNIGLLGRLVRRRHWLGVLTALCVLAFYLDTIVADHTILLEPFLVFGTLLGFVVVFGDTEIATRSSKRWLVAGAVMGLTTSVKIWELIPLIVLLVVASARGSRCLAHYVGGVVSALAVVCGPFFVMAPSKFIHEVIVVQATRSHLGQLDEKSRLWNLLGAAVPKQLPRGAILWALFGLCLVIGLVYLLLLSIRRGYSSRSLTTLDSTAIACLIFVALAFLATAEYDSHYGGFFAPFLALVLSAIVVRLVPFTNTIVKICFVVVLLGYLGLSDRSYFGTKYPNIPTTAIEQTFSPSACVISQVYSPLILSGRYNLFEATCPRALDIYGTELTDGGGAAGFKSDATAPKLQADWLSWLRQADGVILYSPAAKDPNIGIAARSYFEKYFSLKQKVDTLFIYKRT
jgi:alpha-1,2-mannosyltransferase